MILTYVHLNYLLYNMKKKPLALYTNPGHLYHTVCCENYRTFQHAIKRALRRIRTHFRHLKINNGLTTHFIPIIYFEEMKTAVSQQ